MKKKNQTNETAYTEYQEKLISILSDRIRKGNDRYIFFLEDEEIKKYEKWHTKQMKKNKHLPTAGERFTFEFTPSGLGTIKYVRDGELGEEFDITDWKNF